jgi:uncharacterized protein YraI
LNCRSGHATAYPIVKTFDKGTVLTITKEQYGWGYVDGIGWVSLAYVEKFKEPDKIEEEEEMTQEQFNTMMDNWIAE